MTLPVIVLSPACHACHSCSVLLLLQQDRAALYIHAAQPHLVFRYIFPAPCVMICASVGPQVLPHHHHPPSCGCGRTSRALWNVLYPCDSWHGVTQTQPVHRDGLHGCQWKQRRAGSGSHGCGSRDLHDCFQESLGTGKTPHSSIDSNCQSALNQLLFTFTNSTFYLGDYNGIASHKKQLHPSIFWTRLIPI